MESALTNACKIRIDKFEGPFDLLFHLIEKNRFSIYDIPVNIITDQYMEYLFSMRELDMEIASEFLVMAATLLHIKSRMLLPAKKDEQLEESDPREELVMRLLEYRKYKEFANTLREREKHWSKVFYKLPETAIWTGFSRRDENLELSPSELKRVYAGLLEKNMKKANPDAAGINRIIQHEKVSLRSKMREILRELFKKSRIRFSELFLSGTRSVADIVTGFMAVLELAKMKKAKVEQKKLFDEIFIERAEPSTGMSVYEPGKLDSMA